LNSETRYATARQFVLKETFIFYKLQPYENTVNYKRKSRRRFFLLVRSRSPPVSSEFRGGRGFEHPKPPPSVRHCQTYPMHILTFYAYKIHFNIIFPSKLTSPMWSLCFIELKDLLFHACFLYVHGLYVVL